VLPFAECVTSPDGIVKLRQRLKGMSHYDPSKWSVEKFAVSATASVVVHSRQKTRLVLWIHGGGFVLGDAEDDYAQDLFEALEDVDFASVEYRLAPEWPFPAAVDDCRAAVAWVLQKYAAHYDSISLAGVSAGANLALSTVLDGSSGGGVHDVALLYPFVDPRCESESFRDHGHRAGFGDWLRWCWRVYKGNSGGLLPFEGQGTVGSYPDVPMLVVTSRADPLRDDGRALVEHLRSSGVSVVTHVEGRGGHAMMHAVDAAGAQRMFDAWKHNIRASSARTDGGGESRPFLASSS